MGRAIAALPPDQRAVRVTWVGVSTIPADSFASLDRQVRAVTRPLGTRPPTAVVLYRDTRFGKQIVRLGAVNGLGRAVALRSGRLPQSCVPGRCEVVAIGKSGFGAPGFTVTGRGSLRSDPVASFFQSVAPGGRLRLAGGVDGLTRLPALRDSFRTYGWVAPLGPHDVRGWDVDGFLARIGRASTALEASSPNFSLTAPTVALADAGAKSRIAGRRLLLVGGQAVVLLLAFVLLAATRLRRGARASSRRLDSFGATGTQTRLAALAEAALVVVPATLLGWLLGAVTALALAEATDTPPGAVVSRSVASVTAIELMLAVAVLGTLVLYLGSRARAVAIGGLTISIADVAAAGALVAVLVAFAVGGADAQSLASSEGTGIVLMLLPGLIALVAAVVIARVLQPVLRACERAAAGRSLSLKLALLSLARAPGTATVAIVFVSVSVGLAVFAAAYRSTLIRNDSDRAAFEVPLDYTVKQDPRFVSDATPVGSAYAARFNAVPVIRLQGEAPSLDRRAVTFLGLPADDLTRLHWRGDFASESPSELARRIGGPPVRLQGTRIPPGAREFRLPVTIRGDSIHLSANIRRPNGRFIVLDLGEPNNTGKPVVARAPIPPAGRGGLLVGLLVEFSRAEAFTAAHRETGKAPTFAVFRAGVLKLQRPEVSGAGRTRTLPVDYRDWVGAPGDETACRDRRIARAPLPPDPGPGLPAAARADHRQRPASGHRLRVACARDRERHAPALRRAGVGERARGGNRASLSDRLGRLRRLRPLAARDRAQRIRPRIRGRRRGVGLRRTGSHLAAPSEPADSRPHHLTPRRRARVTDRSAGARLAARARSRGTARPGVVSRRPRPDSHRRAPGRGRRAVRPRDPGHGPGRAQAPGQAARGSRAARGARRRPAARRRARARRAEGARRECELDHAGAAARARPGLAPADPRLRRLRSARARPGRRCSHVPAFREQTAHARPRRRA